MHIELDIQEGTLGDWQVDKFTVDSEGARFFNIRQVMDGRNRFISPGEYWRLTHKGAVVMSNTPAEIADHLKFISQAQGCVLIAGLGLGMVLKKILGKDCITKIIVVEKSKEVIELISKFYQDPRLTIVNEDIFKYVPQCKFDFAWFDIWNDISGQSYDEMRKLQNKFRRHVKKSDCWCKKEAHELWKEDQEWDKWHSCLGGSIAENVEKS